MFYPLSTPEAIAVAVWLLVIGGAIGSFLNVVVYRLPRGMSLISPASHCPACSRPIRWRDNLPILGWVLLRGRCRDCGKPISIRYPLVEAVTATLFLTVAVEGFRQGSNLPQRFWPMVDGLSWRSLSPAEAWGIVTYHLMLLTTFWTMTLIEYDGQRLPAQTALPAFLAGGILPLFWPHLRPVPALLVQSDWLAGAIDGLAGLAVGLTLGLAAWRLLRRAAQRRSGEPATPPAGVTAKCTTKRRGKKNLASLPGAAAGWRFARQSEFGRGSSPDWPVPGLASRTGGWRTFRVAPPAGALALRKPLARFAPRIAGDLAVFGCAGLGLGLEMDIPTMGVED